MSDNDNEYANEWAFEFESPKGIIKVTLEYPDNAGFLGVQAIRQLASAENTLAMTMALAEEGDESAVEAMENFKRFTEENTED